MSTPMTMTDCPTDETLAAFLDGRLDAKSRQVVIEHMSSCPDCYAVISAGWDYQQTEETALAPVVRGRFSRKALVWTAGAAAAASMVIVLALPEIQTWIAFQRTGGMSALIAAQNTMKERPFPGRLSGFGYQPYRPKRGSQEESNDETYQVLRAVGQLKDESTARSAHEFHALAAAHLLLNQPGDRDAAIAAIERAGELSPDDPSILNDLAVAYLQRFQYTSNAADAQRALQAAERAWQLAQTSDIAFNRALAFEANGRKADAVRAWQTYLSIDPNSPWAADARRHLDMLQT